MKKSIIAVLIMCVSILASININQTSFADEPNKDTNINEEIKELTQEEAKELLIKKNPELEYVYQGDENTFTVLKEKGFSGYVFLPNVDGDIGFFVDKLTSDIYLFHPSGYMELTK